MQVQQGAPEYNARLAEKGCTRLTSETREGQYLYRVPNTCPCGPDGKDTSLRRRKSVVRVHPGTPRLWERRQSPSYCKVWQRASAFPISLTRKEGNGVPTYRVWQATSAFFVDQLRGEGSGHPAKIGEAADIRPSYFIIGES